MPYAPGVQDISGQLRAQGIAQAGQAWSQAIGNIGKDVADAMQTYKQNQFLTNQALGKFTAATQADPSLLKFLESGGQQEDPNAPKVAISPEVLKAYANIKSGKSDVYDAGLLGTMADTWVKTKQDAMQIQHINLQNKLLTQQAEQNQRMSEFMKQYMAPQAAAAAPAAGAAAPEGIAQFAGQAGAVGAAPAPAAGEPTARDVVAKLIQSTGKMPTPTQVTSQLRQDLQEWRKNQIESKEYATAEQAAAAGKEALAKGIYPEGTIPVVKKNQSTGGFYNETTTSSVEPADVAAKRKALEEQGVGQVKIANNQAEADIKAGSSARKTLIAADRLSNLFEGGKFQTGKGQDFINTARGWAKSLGVNVDESKLSATNEGIAYINQLLLPIYEQQKGAISNREQALYQSMGPGMEKDEAANKALLVTMIERSKTERELERNAQAYAAGDMSHTAFLKKRQSILDAFDAKIPDAPSAAPAPAAAGQPAAGAAQGQYITGATYKNKAGKEFVWDGAKMVPKQ